MSEERCTCGHPESAHDNLDACDRCRCRAFQLSDQYHPAWDELWKGLR